MSGGGSFDDSSAYLVPPSTGTAAPQPTDRRTSQRLLEVAEVEPSARIASALRLNTADRVVLRRRLILKDDRPVEIAESYYPARIAAGTALAQLRRIKGGAPRLLAELGYTTAFADEEVELDATLLAEEAEVLQVRLDQRIVRLFRTAYSPDGAPFEVAAGPMLPEGRTLRHRIIAADQE